MGFAAMTAPQALMAGLSLTGGAIGAIGNKQAADAQKRAQWQAMEAQNAQAYEEQVRARQQQAQIEKQQAQGAWQQRLQSHASKASAKASAANAGVSGGSVDALLNEFDSARAGYAGALWSQMGAQTAYAQQSLRNIGMSRDANIMSINRPVRADILSPALGGVAGAASAWDVAQTNKLKLKR